MVPLPPSTLSQCDGFYCNICIEVRIISSMHASNKKYFVNNSKRIVSSIARLNCSFRLNHTTLTTAVFNWQIVSPMTWQLAKVTTALQSTQPKCELESNTVYNAFVIGSSASVSLSAKNSVDLETINLSPGELMTFGNIQVSTSCYEWASYKIPQIGKLVRILALHNNQYRLDW